MSPYNKVVKYYSRPALYLLGMFEGEHEVHTNSVRDMGLIYNFMLPNIYRFENVEDIKTHIEYESNKDATFEGVVVRDINSMRYKIKCAKYLSLHKMKGEGDNLFNPKYLVPFIMSNELDELYTYFNEVRPVAEKLQEKYNMLLAEMYILWHTYKDIDNQKDFALAVKHSPLSCVLFAARKLCIEPKVVLPQFEGRIVDILTEYKKSVKL